MENQLQIAEHPKFGKFRYLILEGKPWFVATDVCRILGLNTVSKAVRRLRDDEKRLIFIPTKGRNSIPTQGGEQNMTIINEPGFYRLVFASRKPEAVEMQDWVYHDVLPSINATGSYSLVQPAPVVAKPVRVPNPNRVAAQLADASIYVIRVGDEYVKIGNSKNVEERKANLKSWRGLSFGEDYKTVRFPRIIARKIENTCQKIFSPYHVEGEIFHVKYEMARIAIKALEQLVEELPLVSNPKFGDKLLKLAEMMGDTPERQALLLEAGNIFVGKKSV